MLNVTEHNAIFIVIFLCIFVIGVIAYVVVHDELGPIAKLCIEASLVTLSPVFLYYGVNLGIMLVNLAI